LLLNQNIRTVPEIKDHGVLFFSWRIE